MQKNHLIIFSKPLVAGKVKSRLAEELGEPKALAIYTRLFNNTLNAAAQTTFPYTIYFTETPATDDFWPYKIQSGKNLGDRMLQAIKEELKVANKVCLIGGDCYELSSDDLIAAFRHLDKHDIVLGPANDGGYYLIGMKKAYREIFSGISWGDSNVLIATLGRCQHLGLSWYLLPLHTDIDLPKDVPAEWL